MKRHIRIIIGIVFLGISLFCSFYILPTESELYLKSDVSNLENSIFPITIIISIVLAFLMFFDKTEFYGSKWSKLMYIGYIGMMSYLILIFTSDILTAVTLKINRISITQTLNKSFEISYNSSTYNGDTYTSPWIRHFENKYIIYGRISDRYYEDGVDRIIANDDEYNRIVKEEPKKRLSIKLKKGLFGIWFDPKISE